MSASSLFAQKGEVNNETLEGTFKKIDTWTYDRYGDKSFDSLTVYNARFEKLLLKKGARIIKNKACKKIHIT